MNINNFQVQNTVFMYSYVFGWPSFGRKEKCRKYESDKCRKEKYRREEYRKKYIEVENDRKLFD